MINLRKFLNDYGDDIKEFTIISLGEEIKIRKENNTFVVEKINNKYIWNRQDEFPYVNKDYSLIMDEVTNIVRIEVPRFVDEEGELIEQAHSGTWMNYF